MAVRQSPHIPALDGLRGVAALLVVIYHIRGGAIDYDGRPLGDGFLAVDVFFALSGFVLAQAYLWQLRAGMGVCAFMTARLLRLYPLYIAGLAFGIAVALADREWGAAKLSLHAIAGAGVLEAFMLPSRPTHEQLFLINPVAWSLFYELILNLLLAVFWWIGRRALLFVTVVSGAALIGATVHFHTACLGNTWATAGPGFARALFSFCAGIAIQHWRARTGWRFDTCAAACGMAVLIGWLNLPVSRQIRPVFDLAFIMLVSPAILVVAAEAKLCTPWARLAVVAGAISYALYAVHYSAVYPVLNAVAHRRDLNNETTLDVVTAGFVMIMACVAYALSRFYDEPVRRVLRRSLG